MLRAPIQSIPGVVMPESRQALLQMGLAWAILAVGAGLPAWLLFRRNRSRPLLPPVAPWTVPWNGVVVLLAIIIFAFLIPQIVDLALKQSGFFTALYGTDFPASVAPADVKDPVRKQASHVISLWDLVFAFPISFLIIVIGVAASTGASLAQMGLTRERSGLNLVAGYLGWLVLTPVVFGVFATSLALLAPNPEKHPLMDLGAWAGQREWLVFALQAAILAPIGEELVFRGLLLPWLAEPPKSDRIDPTLFVQPDQRSHLVYAAALLHSSSETLASVAAGNWDRVFPLPPGLIFIACLLPFYLLVPLLLRRRQSATLLSSQAIRAIFATSVLFAAVHAAWPSPIPLFVLSLGLGWLALRTRSIIPSVVVHMLFNGIAVILVGISGVG